MNDTVWINNKNGRLYMVLDYNGAGMCEKTIGMTLVVYLEVAGKFRLFVREQKEFNEKFTKK